MRQFGRVETCFWRDPKVRLLTEQGRHLLLYLLTCPHGNAVGCFYLPFAYIASDAKWSLETVRETVRETVAQGLIEYDETHELVWIKNFLVHNRIENPNVAKSCIPMINAVPRQSPVFAGFVESLEPYAERFPNGYVKGLLKGLRRPPEVVAETKSIALALSIAEAEAEAHRGACAPAHEEPPNPTPADDPPDELARRHSAHPELERVRAYIVAKLPHLQHRPAQAIGEWLREGADPERDIFPAVDVKIGQKGADIGSFGFFTRQVTSAVQARRENDEQQQRLRRKYAKPE